MTRKFFVFATSSIFATALFGAWMLTSPIASEAAMTPGIDVSQIGSDSAKNMPSFDEKYQRGTGVLDIFVEP